MAMFKGSSESLNEDWKKVFQTENFYGSTWVVFVRNFDPTNRYLGVKVLSEDYVMGKANYWVTFDKKLDRITSRGTDALLMKSLRPELHDVVKKELINLVRHESI